MSIAPGQIIGSYRVVEKIGEGGMGAVYRAEDTAIQRSVVLKVLGTTGAGDPEMLQRFQREVEMIASLEHPHILPVYEYGQVEGDPYIAMRFMRGGSLHDRLQDAGTTREQLLRIFEQVAEALDFAHDRDVVHRDLKPGNVLLDESGNAYLADFGLAKTMQGSRDLTATGGILGTPAYMSPEQARGEKLDRRSDIYALAVMVFEALSGQYPFTANTPMEFLYKHLSERPRSILTVAPEVPLAVDGVLTQALAKEPAQRPGSATEFMGMLRQALVEAVAPAQAGGAAGRGAARPSAGRRVGARPAGGRAASQATSVPGRGAADAGAGAVAAAGSAGVGVLPRGRPRRFSMLLLAPIGGAVLLAAALGVGALLFRESLLGPRVHSYPVGQAPRALASDGRSVWVIHSGDDTIAQLAAAGCEISPDPCGQALASYRAPTLPLAVAYDGEWLWVAGALSTVVRIDPTSGEQQAQFSLPDVPTAMALADGALWIVNDIGRSLTRIDTASSSIERFPVDMRPLAILWDGETLWVASGEDRLVARVDPADGQTLQTIPLEGAPAALASDGQDLWVALSDQAQLVKLDRSEGSVLAKVEVGAGPRALLFDGAMLWSANQRGNSVSGVDPTRATVESTLRVRGGPYALAWVPCGVGCGDLWVASEAGDTVSRIRLQ